MAKHSPAVAAVASADRLQALETVEIQLSRVVNCSPTRKTNLGRARPLHDQRGWQSRSSLWRATSATGRAPRQQPGSLNGRPSTSGGDRATDSAP